jgi:hypothetical protein
MPSHRHHYRPQFLLRHFAATEGERIGLVWRADLDGSRVLQIAPKHEAAKRHYYRVPAELESPMSPEEILQRVESLAAAAIRAFEQRGSVDLNERQALALFVVLQHRRTPSGRRELRFMDEFVARQEMELRIADRKAARSFLSKEGSEPSEQAVEAWQERDARTAQERRHRH